MGNSQQFSSGSASGDFDNDGDIDIAIKEYGNDKTAILLNEDNPLPVELSSFTSQVITNDITLNWITSSEENNSGFDVERQIVGRETQNIWSKIGFVNGNGTSNSSNNYSFTDKNLQSGKYKYRLKQTDFNGNFKYYELANEVVIGSPEKFELSQNYPNPFNPVTHLGFGISNLGFVSLKVYNNSGKEVKTLVNEVKPAGFYEIEFDGSTLASGIYFYTLRTDNFSETRRMILLK
ncbi:MAG TPA: T9SS type A sorting domain-containing protein [Ignavibacteria bacterium]|nr:T9SS type A sorting domain-containing protein [Ignavibacteria bacterium]